MLLSQISNECWLLPVVEGQVGQGREVPDKDLKESAGAGVGGTADSALGQAEVWVLMVQEYKDQSTTGSERRRRCLLLYQGSAGAGGVRVADGGERASGDRGVGVLFPKSIRVSGFLICETGEATPSTSV